MNSAIDDVSKNPTPAAAEKHSNPRRRARTLQDPWPSLPNTWSAAVLRRLSAYWRIQCLRTSITCARNGRPARSGSASSPRCRRRPARRRAVERDGTRRLLRHEPVARRLVTIKARLKIVAAGRDDVDFERMAGAGARIRPLDPRVFPSVGRQRRRLGVARRAIKELRQRGKGNGFRRERPLRASSLENRGERRVLGDEPRQVRLRQRKKSAFHRRDRRRRIDPSPESVGRAISEGATAEPGMGVEPERRGTPRAGARRRRRPHRSRPGPQARKRRAKNPGRQQALPQKTRSSRR